MTSDFQSPTLPPAPPFAPAPINDEEPSPSPDTCEAPEAPDAFDRFCEALDDALDPDEMSTSLPSLTVSQTYPQWCRRCGYGRLYGTWLARTEHPRGCPNCHTSYWDIPAKTARGKIPDFLTTQEAERRRRERNDERRRYRHLAMVRALAEELGVSIVDPRTEKPPRPRKPRRPPDKPKTRITPRVDTIAAPPSPAVAGPPMPPLAFRRTVPPPPGIEELESEKP